VAKILVVDDDPSLLKLAQVVLAKANHEVVLTQDPNQAVCIAEEQAVDAIVLDVMLPGRNGFDVLADLRGNPATQKVVVLMLSALSEGQHRVRGLRGGADDYLSKPLEPDELLLKLDKLLPRTNQENGTLTGSLEHFPLAEILQNLHQGARRGVLVVEAGTLRGEIRLQDGYLDSAVWADLQGREAVWTMLGLGQGRFHFEQPVDGQPLPPSGEQQVSAMDLVMHAAWIKDQLARRAELPPETSLLPVDSVVDYFARVGGEFTSLPLTVVVEAVQNKPGICFSELLQLQLAAPQRVRLAVMVLAENAAIRLTSSQATASTGPPATCNAS
jgi:DNA-binding response OmpR family regulator